MIATLSPLKPSRYFDGELTDGNAVIRLVGFDKAQQQHLLSYCEKEVPITLTNCQVQYNRSKSKLEVVLKPFTKIQRSPMQFDIPDIKTVGSPIISLSELDKQEEYDRVTVKVKVIKTKDPQQVATGKIKQDVVIADATAKCLLVLWESNINKLVNHKSYQLSRVVVRVFMGKHHLALPETGATVDEIDDVENLDVNADSSEEEEESIMEATVIGVQAFDKSFSCMNCKNNLDPTNDSIGICSSCNITQKLMQVKLSAKIFIQSTNNSAPISVRANTQIIQEIAQKKAALITTEDVLFAPKFNVTFNKFHLITKVTRE